MNMSNGQFTLASIEDSDGMDNDSAANTDEGDVNTLEGDQDTAHIEDGMSCSPVEMGSMWTFSLTLILFMFHIFFASAIVIKVPSLDI